MDPHIEERVNMQENIKRNLMVKMLLKHKRTRIDLFNYKDTYALRNTNKHSKNKALMTIENQFGFVGRAKTKTETIPSPQCFSSNTRKTYTNDSSLRKSPQSRQIILSKAIMDTFKLNKQKDYMRLSSTNTLSLDTQIKTTTNILENTLKVNVRTLLLMCILK